MTYMFISPIILYEVEIRPKNNKYEIDQFYLPYL